MILAIPGLGYRPRLGYCQKMVSAKYREAIDGIWAIFTCRMILIIPHLGVLFMINSQFSSELLPLIAIGEKCPLNNL